MKSAKRTTFWAHAYLRMVGRVEAVLGQRRVSLSDASKILDDSRGDEEFFARGITRETKTAYVGNVPDVGYLGAFEFAHELPKRKKS